MHVRPYLVEHSHPYADTCVEINAAGRRAEFEAWAVFLAAGVLDDRDQVVRMWRDELGLTCLQVAPGDF